VSKIKLEEPDLINLCESDVKSFVDHLILDRNNLFTLPNQFTLLDNLTKLTIIKNNLQTIPHAVFSLKKLEQLTLTSNQISVISEDIVHMTSLKELSIDKNQLEDVPAFIANCPQLEWIILEGNPIQQELPDEMLTKESLNIIYLFEEMQEVVPGVFIGSHSYERRMKDVLKEKGITHILFVLNKANPSHPEDFTYMMVDIEDSEKQHIGHHVFEEACQFISQGKESGGILVNCECGISRSATIMLSYLMWSLNIPYEEAFLLLRRKRPAVKPNLGFKRQLIEWDNERKNTTNNTNLN